MALKNNTWKLNQWYDQDVAGNVSYSGATQLWVWGGNSDGALGLSQPENSFRSSPVQMTGTTWSQVLSNENGGQSIALKTDGTLWGWGLNTYGQLGQNNTTRYSSPVQVGGDTTWLRATGNEQGFYITKTDGTLWAMGYNQGGKLGQNSLTDYSSPVQIDGSTWKVTGQYGINSFGIVKTDGTLWTWGRNHSGQMGINSRTWYSSPVQVPGTTWEWISGGTGIGALKTDGTLWMWGAGSNGQLGQNNRTSRSSPVQVGSETTWSKINLIDRGNAFVATKTDGTLWTWGNNDDGWLGQNNTIKISSPTQVGSSTDWSIPIGGDYRHAAAMKTDGTLWIWGSNGQGELGLNSVIYYSSPVQVPGTYIQNQNSSLSRQSNVLKMI